MPKEPIDYSKTVMYRIICKNIDITENYVGYTTNLKSRRANHYSKCENEFCRSYNYKVYKFIRENGGFLNWQILEIEKYPCKDLGEATRRERYWYEHYNASLNYQIPSQTIKENKRKYYMKNREKICEYNSKRSYQIYRFNKESKRLRDILQ